MALNNNHAGSQGKDGRHHNSFPTIPRGIYNRGDVVDKQIQHKINEHLLIQLICLSFNESKLTVPALIRRFAIAMLGTASFIANGYV
jgi:hypothetical protein